MLSLLHHPNIVDLIGYCADGDHHRLLVYKYMPLGSLKDYLHGNLHQVHTSSFPIFDHFRWRYCLDIYDISADVSPGKKQLDWETRTKISLEAAKGLEYLHDKSQPPVIHRNINCSNILLDEGYQAKLSGFSLAKLGSIGGKTHVSMKLEGTIGYIAPEYVRTGELSLKSDIYSFGVVLLEIFTGKRAIENSTDGEECNLVEWVRYFCSYIHSLLASMKSATTKMTYPV